MNLPGTRSPWLGSFEKYDFVVADRPVTVVCPRHPLAGLPWAWKGEFLNAFPNTELALLDAGFHCRAMGGEYRRGGEAISRAGWRYSTDRQARVQASSAWPR